MATKLAIRDGGKTSEEGGLRLLSRRFSSEGVLRDASLIPAAAGTPDNTVRISTGDIIIGDNSPSATEATYYYHGWVTSEESVTITANSSGNARIDAIVAYIDKSVVSSASNDNPGVLKFAAVAGTPAASPVPPTDSAIQTAVTAGNPWVLIAEIAVANGFSTITNSNITDLRPRTDTQIRILDDIANDFILSGFVWAVPGGTSLVTTMSAGRGYYQGYILNKPTVRHTFTASKDTYVDVPYTATPTENDDLNYTEVANGAAAPSIAANSIRVAKVVTNGTTITASTDLRAITPFNHNNLANRTRTVMAEIAPENGAVFASNFGLMVQCADESTQGASFIVRVPDDYVSGGTLYLYYSAPSTGSINILYSIGSSQNGAAMAHDEANSVNEILSAAVGDTMYAASFVLAGGYVAGELIYGLFRRRTGDANTGNMYIKAVALVYTADM